MKKGLYRYSKDELFNSGVITIEVSETNKSYIFKLIENTFRYSPAHIDMLFSKSNRIMINKEKNPHAINIGEDYFVIYPYRAGIPFLFDYVESKSSK